MILPAVNVEEFERKYVNDVYEKLAKTCFKSTIFQNDSLRHKRWDKVDDFLDSFPQGSAIADLGFGDGRYLQNSNNDLTVGVEKCKLLCEKLSSSGNETLAADITRLPFRKGFFDGIVCVDVIHHLATRKRRLKALLEIARTLRPGGKAFISIWGIEATFRELGNCDVLVPIRRNIPREKPCIVEDDSQDYSKKKSFYFIRSELSILKNQLLNKIFQEKDLGNSNPPLAARGTEENLCSVDSTDINIELRKNKNSTPTSNEKTNVSENEHRYYHVFTQKEFIELLLGLRCFTIVDTYLDRHSWVFIMSRK